MNNKKSNIKTARTLSLIQGILLIILGIIFIANPLTSLVSLGMLVSVLVLVSGIIGIIRYFSSSYFTGGAYLVMSILEIILGIILYRSMPFTSLALGIIVGFGVLFSSVSQIAISLDLRHFGFDRWWLNLIAGILGIIVGFMLVSDPGLTPIYVGIYGLVYGISFISIFFALGRFTDDD